VVLFFRIKGDGFRRDMVMESVELGLQKTKAFMGMGDQVLVLA
jgi:hypothetical protein